MNWDSAIVCMVIYCAAWMLVTFIKSITIILRGYSPMDTMAMKFWGAVIEIIKEKLK